MRRIFLWSLLGLSLSANVAVAAIAAGRGPLPPGVPPEPPIFSKVSLDPDQRARIAALRETLLAERAERASRLAALRADLAGEITGEAVDRAAIDGTLAAIEAAQSEFQRRVVEHVLAVRELLRPEQRPAFRSLVAQHMASGAPLDPSAPFAGAAQCGARR